jgi:hypothetical protein
MKVIPPPLIFRNAIICLLTEVNNSGYTISEGGGHYVTRRKDAGSRPDEVNTFSLIYLILPASLGPGVHSASNRNEHQKQKNNVSGE